MKKISFFKIDDFRSQIHNKGGDNSLNSQPGKETTALGPILAMEVQKMKKLVILLTVAAFALVAMPAFSNSLISMGQENYADLRVSGGYANIFGESLVEGTSSSINGNTWVGMGSTFQSDVYAGETITGGVPVVSGIAASSISSYGDVYASQGNGFSSAYVNSDTSVTSFSAGNGFSGAAVSNFGYADSESFLNGSPLRMR